MPTRSQSAWSLASIAKADPMPDPVEHAAVSGSPKHIALVGPLYPYRGGIAHFLGEMHQGLAARGHQVTAVTFTRQFPALLFPGQTQFETTPVSHTLPIERLIDTINPVSWLKTARLIKRQNPDAVIFHYWMPFFAPAFGTIARRLKGQGIRIIAVVHNAIPHERRPGDYVLGRYFLNACDQLMVMSDAVEKDLGVLDVSVPRTRFEHPIYDVFGETLSMPEARLKLGLNPKAPTALFFGFIRRYKGLMNLLACLPQVVRALPGLQLIVAGECYEDDAAYRDFAAENGLEDVVHWHLKYIPSDEVNTYFSAADVVVQPYISATQSGVAQIAYHFDRPLIVTDVGGLAEFVPDGKAGLVVPPDDNEALGHALIRFFEDDLGPHLQAGVREEKKKYSWDRLYEAVESLL